MIGRPRVTSFTLVAFAVMLARSAQAHPRTPALLDLTERSGTSVEVTWKHPVRAPGAAARRPELPEECSPVGPPEVSADERALTQHWVVDCGPAGLVGRRVGVRGLAAGTNALLRVRLRDGRTIQRVLRPGAPFSIVPERTPRRELVGDYVWLGVEHILGGADHLLFVFGLVLLVGGAAPLVRTVSGFTLGHSVTLALAAFGFVQVPTRAIEVLIAASVFWLAVDLADRGAERAVSMRRAPGWLAGGFGLLHGLGFAGALSEAGLPSSEIPLALVSFNAGIELGQLAFVAAVLAARRVIDRVPFTLPAWSARLPVYAMGSLAAFWCWERLVLLVP